MFRCHEFEKQVQTSTVIRHRSLPHNTALTSSVERQGVMQSAMRPSRMYHSFLRMHAPLQYIVELTAAKHTYACMRLGGIYLVARRCNL